MDRRASAARLEADENLPSRVPIEAELGRLARRYSLEVTPKDVRAIARVAPELGPDAAVYITSLPGADPDDVVAAAEAIAGEGLRPVPHVAARSIASLTDLDRLLARLAGRAGVHEVLVIGGSLARPVGLLRESLDVIRSGLLEAHGIRRVGVAGHPEGSKDVGARALRDGLREKNALAAGTGLDLYLVTQFCFAPEPYVEWERRIRADGNELPIHVGLPGVTSASTLLRFGAACGIGPSLSVLRKQAGGVLRLAAGSPYRPDRIASGIAEAAAADPGCLFRQFHFFPFGGLESTVRWANLLRAGPPESEQADATAL